MLITGSFKSSLNDNEKEPFNKPEFMNNLDYTPSHKGSLEIYTFKSS